MEVYGRNILDSDKKIDLKDIDEVVFVKDGKRIVVSIYGGKTKNHIEVRCLDGVMVVLPHASNVIHIESRR